MVSTTNEVLLQAYCRWLTEKVTRGDRHNDLMEILFNKEFVWIVSNDDNRIEDGLDLRREFLLDIHFFSRVQLEQIRFPHILGEVLHDRQCSFLEVLIGLSRRLSFEAGGIPEVWAWKLIENLELHRFRDPLTPRKRERIDERLEEVIFRNYQPDGVGGFFPLAFPEQDQTKVELWYQMSAYIDEHPDL